MTAARVTAQPGSSTKTSSVSPSRSSPRSTCQRSAESMSGEPVTWIRAKSLLSLLSET
ncbi:hypothetical protein B0E53_03838 [Micromonospora sp. MH33]|nr:hypothetical protein B0E53_03838 [Micromonospora sp. MH33]